MSVLPSASLTMSHQSPPRKKQGYVRKPVFIGVLAGAVFSATPSSQHKKAGMDFRKKIHAAKSANQVEEPEAGRMIQSQMSNLVIGVVPCPLRITHATSDRVGSCGAKLLNGFNETPVAGRPTASLPVRAQSTRAARTRQARKFLPRKGSPAGDWSAPEKLDTQVIGWE